MVFYIVHFVICQSSRKSETILDRDYEGNDAVRKFTHDERIAPFGESRFPEQFLADNTCAGWVLIGRRETSVGPRDRFYWIFLEICRCGTARRAATQRDGTYGLAGEATIRLTQNFEYCSNFLDRIPRIVAAAIRSLARISVRGVAIANRGWRNEREEDDRTNGWRTNVEGIAYRRPPLCMGNASLSFPSYLSPSLGERDRFSFNTPTPTYASARLDLPGGHDE